MDNAKKLNLRLPPGVAESAKTEAAAMGLSLNAYIVQAVQNYVPWTRKHRASWEGSKSLRAAAPPSRRQAVVGAVKVGRNDPCPCGSGRKAKQCHPESC